MINSLAWIAWLTAILVALSATRNPLYLILIFLWIAVVTIGLRPVAGVAPVPISPVRFGLIVISFSALFNGLTVHVGSTVLFRLPKTWLLIGGPITLEALVFGLLNGLVLTGIFAAFTVLNKVLPVRALIRLIPRTFYPVAVVVSIAVTFVPTTLRQFQQIRDAQAVRGHRVRGLRDWLPLMLPLLVGGLERALQLAEAMMARGFASAEIQIHDAKTRLVIIAGLIAILSGWLLRLLWSQTVLGGSLLLVGVGLIAGVLWVMGQRIPHTVYRSEVWTWRDWGIVLGAALVVAAFLLPLPNLDRASIFYYPYPRLILPGFNLAIGVATLGLLGPVLLLYRGKPI